MFFNKGAQPIDLGNSWTLKDIDKVWGPWKIRKKLGVRQNLVHVCMCSDEDWGLNLCNS